MSAEVSIYGKLPAHGDYILVSLPSTLEAQIHRWLSAVIVEAESVLGKESWLKAFLMTPPVCFVLNLNTKPQKSLFGVMIPSVDKVGRYFPLMTGVYLNKHFTLSELDREVLDKLANAIVNEQVTVMHEYQPVDMLVKKIMNLTELENIKAVLQTASSHISTPALHTLKQRPILSSCWWELDNPNPGIEANELPSVTYYQSILSRGAHQ